MTTPLPTHRFAYISFDNPREAMMVSEMLRRLPRSRWTCALVTWFFLLAVTLVKFLLTDIPTHFTLTRSTGTSVHQQWTQTSIRPFSYTEHNKTCGLCKFTYHTSTDPGTDASLLDVSINENATSMPGAEIDNGEISVNELVSNLSKILQNKLRRISDSDRLPRVPACINTTVIGNSCQPSGCLQLHLPEDIRDRVEQLIQPDHLRINSKMLRIFATMEEAVPGYYDIILLSAVSSSHYLETQALLYNLHTNLFPHLSNFTFILYNLGLKPKERDHLTSICRCHLLDFPFQNFPEFVSFRKCYTWKPLIVKAHFARANALFWLDASVRFGKDIHRILQFIKRGKERGFYLGPTRLPISFDTVTAMFHFFGDEACAYAHFPTLASGCFVINNEVFTNKAILEPWVACALSDSCMCPKKSDDVYQIRLTCHNEAPPYTYGVCHRFDQSALSIILSKLYQEYFGNIYPQSLADFDIRIQRGHQLVYPTTSGTGSQNANISSSRNPEFQTKQ